MSRNVQLHTTVIGAYPKPSYLKIPDWFADADSDDKKGLLGTSTSVHSEHLKNMTAEQAAALETDVLKATTEVIEEQCSCGIDLPTDGEIRRENYIHFLCRYIEGIDFEKLTETAVRNNAFVARIPTVTGNVKWRDGLNCAEEWKKSQEAAPPGSCVKYTLPGPMTIIGSVADSFYKNDEKLAQDLAKVVNRHVVELAKAGCKHIQVDEPLFARKPDDALSWGVKTLDVVFEGCPKEVEKTVHICCGYPGHLDQTEYLKADVNAYFRLAPAIDASTVVDAVSLEDAWRNNDLSLLAQFKKTKVILGTMNSASSRVESVEEMRERLANALDFIEPERLCVAPDCGLGLFSGSKHRANLNLKLKNMCEAAKSVPLSGKRKAAFCAAYSGGAVAEQISGAGA